MPDTDAIKTELDGYFNLNRLQPGDKDVQWFVENYDISPSRARQKMDEIAKDGVFKVVKVRIDGKERKVLRKIV